MEADPQPKSFEEHLTDRYVRPSEDHEADKVRNLAERLMQPFSASSGRYHSGASRRKTLPDGRKVRETIFPVERELNGQKMHFTLMAEMTHGFIKERLSLRRSTDSQPISLIVNYDYSNPAAYILPGVDGVRSASVVVGETVNDTAHLQHIFFILSEIEQEKINRLTFE